MAESTKLWAYVYKVLICYAITVSKFDSCNETAWWFNRVSYFPIYPCIYESSVHEFLVDSLFVSPTNAWHVKSGKNLTCSWKPSMSATKPQFPYCLILWFVNRGNYIAGLKPKPAETIENLWRLSGQSSQWPFQRISWRTDYYTEESAVPCSTSDLPACEQKGDSFLASKKPEVTAKPQVKFMPFHPTGSQFTFFHKENNEQTYI